MSPGQILAIIFAILWLLILLLLLLSYLRQRHKQSGGSGSDGLSDDGGFSSEQLRRQIEEAARRELEQKKALVKSIVENGDPMLAQQLLKMAGQEHRSLQDMSSDRELVEKMARKMTLSDLQMYSVAASQQDIKFNLQSKTVDVASQYPTRDVEVEKMASFDDMPSLTPESLCLDDDAFYSQLAQEQHLVLKYYDHKVDRPYLYILEDVSGSMKQSMADNVPRHSWARGVTINLLGAALKGNASYLHRFFDSQPFELSKVDTPAEAQGLIDKVACTGLSDGGTNIWNAFATAVSDIRLGSQEFKNFDVLLITDGEDKSMDNTSAVKAALGSDIRLHAIMIGNESPALKAAATTYKVFH